MLGSTKWRGDPTALSDPGETVRLGKARWRLVERSADLEDALARLDIDALESAGELSVRTRKGKAFSGSFVAAGRRLFLKGRTLLRARDRWASWVKTGALRKEWRRTWWVRAQGIDTVEPVAAGEERRFGQLRNEVLLVRWIDGARSAAAFLAERRAVLEPGAFESLRLDVVERLGRVFGALHAARACHRQFHAGNVLVAGGDDVVDALRFLPIDFKHLTIVPVLGPAEWEWSFRLLLEWLGAPVIDWGPERPDLERFARGYHEAAGGGSGDFNALLERVRALAARPSRAARPEAVRVELAAPGARGR